MRDMGYDIYLETVMQAKSILTQWRIFSYNYDIRAADIYMEGVAQGPRPTPKRLAPLLHMSLTDRPFAPCQRSQPLDGCD
jgi:hypothetical protein